MLKHVLTFVFADGIIIITIVVTALLQKIRSEKRVNMKNQTTSKKQKFVGVKEFLDPTTNTLVPMQITTIEERDFDFSKVWMRNLINSMDDIVNQKMRLAFWIIDNLNKENQLIMTQRKIAEKTGISLKTVSSTMKMLCEPENGSLPFLQKINSGAYRVNPDVMFKGSHSNRMGIVMEYHETRREQAVIKEQIKGQTEMREVQ